MRVRVKVIMFRSIGAANLRSMSRPRKKLRPLRKRYIPLWGALIVALVPEIARLIDKLL